MAETCRHCLTNKHNPTTDPPSFTFTFIGLQTHSNHLKCTIFPAGDVGSVKNFKYISFGFLSCVCGLIIVSCWLCLWFLICGLVHILFCCVGVHF